MAVSSHSYDGMNMLSLHTHPLLYASELELLFNEARRRFVCEKLNIAYEESPTCANIRLQHQKDRQEQELSHRARSQSKRSVCVSACCVFHSVCLYVVCRRRAVPRLPLRFELHPSLLPVQASAQLRAPQPTQTQPQQQQQQQQQQ